MKIPRDLIVCFIALLGETYAYFLFSYLLMPYLLQQLHLTNVQSGFIYAAFGGILLVMSIVFGSLIDKLLLRKTLLLQLAVGTVSMWLLSASSNIWWTCSVLFGPITFALSIGLPAIPVAVRRYTTLGAQTMGFGVLFVVMNLGTALAQVSADLFRIHVLPLDKTLALAYFPAYSVLFVCMSMVHFVNYVLVTVFVRDVYVVDDAWTLARVHRVVLSKANIGGILRTRNFWLFVILSLGTTGAKAIYRYLDSLYPIYMSRAPFNVPNPAEVPYMTLLLINPTLSCILTPICSWLVMRFSIHPFDGILLGCFIAAGSSYFMLLVTYWGVILFIVTLTIGESMWVPLLSTYTNYFCEPGSEGIFYSLATIPLFAAKVISGSLTGLLLERYCWEVGHCGEGWVIWLIIGLITTSSPVLLVATCRWTRLKR